MIREGERGQALVLVLLSLSVVLTLVLYILSRSITDVSISSGQDEAVRAFSAAEAGIERSLVVGTGFSSPQSIGNASYTTSVSAFAEGATEVNLPSPLSLGDTATVWFVGHSADGSLTCSPGPCFQGTEIKVCWGNPGTSNAAATTPAIELSVYYETTLGDLGTVKIARAAIDPNTGRRSSNIFDASGGTCQIGDQNYQFSKTITFSSLSIPAASYQNPGYLQLARIRMLYNTDTPHVAGVVVSGGGTLPSQGLRIDSSGSAGESNRRIIQYRAWGESPYSGNTLLSPVGITK